MAKTKGTGGTTSKPHGDGEGGSSSRPSQKVGNVDASKSVSSAQDATHQLAQAGRAGSHGNSTTPAGASPPPSRTDPAGTSPNSKPGDADLNDRSSDPQNPTTDANKRNTEGDPIDIASGEMILQQTDVELQGVLPLVLKRTHLSSYRVGLRFGESWTSTLDQRLEFTSSGVSFAAEDGKLLVAPTPAVGATARFAGSLHQLTRGEDGNFTITEFDTGRTLHFTTGDTNAPLTAIVARNGDRIDFDHDETGTPVEVRHSGGYRIRVDSEDGLVTALHLRGADNGSDVPLMRYAYEGRRLTEVVNASGLPLRFDYDSHGRITSWTDRNDKWYRFSYNAEGRVIAGEGSGGFLSGTMTYDVENRITTWTNSQGASTTYHLNEAGQTIREIDSLGGETLSEWDEFDRLLSRTDPLGRTVRYDHDDEGNLIAVTRPDGTQARFEYNALRLPITIVAPDGSVSRREYDEHGNVTKAIDPTGAVTGYAYDEQGTFRASPTRWDTFSTSRPMRRDFPSR
ncbi:DUF6531 domain-containing protein [Saccharopolyspora flava]|uniref:YD repeat-containing protein n=1 Tax=Saccharopolyspora flava TaxID=95161 RepID=A0A1I6PBL7_9PSEU|nr:DUF6531 domain-containing protein [Saccharopolyspora flava]SFS37594.1 YD repeat-containing protein [Saccharopolyspora flava]